MEIQAMMLQTVRRDHTRKGAAAVPGDRLDATEEPDVEPASLDQREGLARHDKVDQRDGRSDDDHADEGGEVFRPSGVVSVDRVALLEAHDLSEYRREEHGGDHSLGSLSIGHRTGL
jgi:hypothetical protein